MDRPPPIESRIMELPPVILLWVGYRVKSGDSEDCDLPKPFLMCRVGRCVGELLTHHGWKHGTSGQGGIESRNAWRRLDF